jgi:molecular chaperone GrpE (heat shock protein)
MENLQAKIEEVKRQIKSKQAEIDNFEIDQDEFEEQYCEMLDCEGPVKVAGLTFEASAIIREMDPTAYRCGLVDYVDSINKSEVKEYQELEEQLEELESELLDLEEELKNMDQD